MWGLIYGQVRWVDRAERIDYNILSSAAEGRVRQQSAATQHPPTNATRAAQAALPRTAQLVVLRVSQPTGRHSNPAWHTRHRSRPLNDSKTDRQQRKPTMCAAVPANNRRHTQPANTPDTAAISKHYWYNNNIDWCCPTVCLLSARARAVLLLTTTTTNYFVLCMIQAKGTRFIYQHKNIQDFGII